MKDLRNLPKDIYRLFEEGHKPSEESLNLLSKDLIQAVNKQMLPRPEDENKDILRMSMLGKKCNRQVWYSKYFPQKAESLKGHTKIKFLFGDLIEGLLAFLVREAGYKLTGQQDKLHLDGVDGHRDGAVEGITVDFKSASSYSFKKFEEEGGLLKDDPFGYLHQLSGYIEGDKTPHVKDDKGAFIAMDKQNGNIAVSMYKKKDLPDVKARIKQLKEVLQNDQEPPRSFEPVPEGKSGNLKLGTYCSYCNFKRHCHRDANGGKGLRLFLYASRPLFLSTVVREPNVPEIKWEEAEELVATE